MHRLIEDDAITLDEMLHDLRRAPEEYRPCCWN